MTTQLTERQREFCDMIAAELTADEEFMNNDPVNNLKNNLDGVVQSAMARVHARMWRYLNDERETQILKAAMAAKVYNGIHADMNAQWCVKQLEGLDG